ncbi:MAG: DsbA family protein [Pseudomonadota bacterium]
MHTVDYFHQVDDPYSHLMAQVLPLLAERFDVRIKVHLVSPPPDWAAPDRQRLVEYSRRDAATLAAKAGLDFTDPGGQPNASAVEHAEAAIAALIDAGQAVGRTGEICAALWGRAVPTTPAADPVRVAELQREGDSLRDEGGHYLGAVIHYGNEWYWGLDRLHYLEDRLRALGAVKADAPEGYIFPPPETGSLSPAGALPSGTVVEAFLSFRSPYSYLAASRIKDLAAHHDVPVRVRFVLPMVMRGLEVPRPKGRYIIFDVAREARRLGLPFGKIADPVGTPVERGYALMPRAIAEGKEMDYAISFLTGVWAEGMDACSDSGLRTIAERAGLDWAAAREDLGRDDWRAVEAENQQALLDLGIWGVPSFRVGAVSTWGQDRLWVIEDALRAMAQSEADQASAMDA